MNACHVDALSAMFDGEQVDPTLLREALDEPDAPQWLVDFAAWRAEFRQDTSQPSAAFYQAMDKVLRPSRWRRFIDRSRVTLLTATAAAVVCVIVGFLGRAWMEQPLAPPVIRPPAQATAIVAPPTRPAPEAAAVMPSRRMRFPNWHESRATQ